MSNGVVHLNQASSGAPRLSGTAGDLVSVIAWASTNLVSPWSTPFSTTNKSVFKMSGGRQQYLGVFDDGTVSATAQFATVRAAEGASGASGSSALTNAYPLPTQVADGSAGFGKSSALSTTARNYDIWISPTFIHMAVNSNGTAQVWEYNAAGDASPTESADAYSSFCTTRGSSVGGAPQGLLLNTQGLGNTTNVGIFWDRDITGTVLSSRGFMGYNGSTSPGLFTGLAAAKGGYANQVVREKLAFGDFGSAGSNGATALESRGWIPQLWLPKHNGLGGIVDADVWSDTGYSATAQFCARSNTGWLILENTDTWTGVPVG